MKPTQKKLARAGARRRGKAEGGCSALGVGVPPSESWPEDPTGVWQLYSGVGVDSSITHFYDPKKTSACDGWEAQRQQTKIKIHFK